MTVVLALAPFAFAGRPRFAHAIARRARRFAPLLLILFFCAAASSPLAAKKHPPSKPLDLNTASAQQLSELPGIGPNTANAIVQFRIKSGPFRRVDDLLAIHGISQSKLDKLRPYVAVAAPHSKSPPPNRE